MDYFYILYILILYNLQKNTMFINATIQSSPQIENFDTIALSKFKTYLHIPSVHPNVDYEPCVKFLQEYAQDLNLSIVIHRFIPTKPIVILTWLGSDPKRSTILLNSHMDVVPVYAEKWTREPFGAEMDEGGKIYGRGTQDMKSVGIQYLEAIRRLRSKGIILARTVHISFTPDEEIGGFEGMRLFVKSKAFQTLNIGFALDEGAASPIGTYYVYYGERYIWVFQFRCTGTTGHGSLLHENTAAEKVRRLLDRIMDFRDQERAKLKANHSLTIGDVVTLNPTIFHGGVQANVVPPEFNITVDIRLPVTVQPPQFEAQIEKWVQESGPGITVEKRKDPRVPPTNLDNHNIYWRSFKQTADELGMKLSLKIFPAGTDGNYIRNLGIPVIGFSPMIHTPVLLHDNDEFLSKDVFLRGIEIYSKIIPALANC